MDRCFALSFTFSVTRGLLVCHSLNCSLSLPFHFSTRTHVTQNSQQILSVYIESLTLVWNKCSLSLPCVSQFLSPPLYKHSSYDPGVHLFLSFSFSFPPRTVFSWLHRTFPLTLSQVYFFSCNFFFATPQAHPCPSSAVEYLCCFFSSSLLSVSSSSRCLLFCLLVYFHCWCFLHHTLLSFSSLILHFIFFLPLPLSLALSLIPGVSLAWECMRSFMKEAILFHQSLYAPLTHRVDAPSPSSRLFFLSSRSQRVSRMVKHHSQ